MSRDEKIDFSSLEPSVQGERGDSRVREIVSQAQLLRRQRERGEPLDLLDVLSNEPVFEQKIEGILRAVHGEKMQLVSRSWGLRRQVTKVGPGALAIGALLAAATWLGALWIPPPEVRSAASGESPGLQLATWAEQGRVPQTEDILMVMEVVHVAH